MPKFRIYLMTDKGVRQLEIKISTLLLKNYWNMTYVYGKKGSFLKLNPQIR